MLNPMYFSFDVKSSIHCNCGGCCGAGENGCACGTTNGAGNIGDSDD